MNEITVVIPSWSRLAPEMEVETGCRYAAFIRLGGTPLYRHLISQYDVETDRIRFVFVLADDAPDLDPDQLDSTYVIDVVRLSHSGSIADTVLAGLKGQAAKNAVIVHMADTLLNNKEVPSGDVVYVQERKDLYRWTSVNISDDGQVNVLSDREQVDSPEPQTVCVGIFSFTDGTGFERDLKSAIKNCPNSREPFFFALEQYSARRPMTLQTVERWYDCGHIDTFHESRLLYQNLRHFNTLSYEPTRGQVTKTSSASEAFRHQVRWFKQVPDELDAFLPRIFDSSDGAQPFITMELLSIPTLSDLFTTQRLSLGAWNGVVQTIKHILSKFEAMATPSALAPQLARSVYLDKTHTRLTQFTTQLPAATNYWIEENGERWTISRVQQTLAKYVDQTGLLEIKALAPIHGDFCFSNLLYDVKVRLVKMIDPRGEFGVPGIFGDSRYDLAKLAHSYSGGYDFIVADRFALEMSPNGQINVNLRTGEYHAKVRSICDTMLLSDPGLRNEVNALQSLLFLSMLPLHVDKPRRQLAMLAIGLRKYAQAWNNHGGI